MGEWKMKKGEEERSGCYYHPRERVVGVCHLCLKQRLVMLGAENKKTKKKLVGVVSSSSTSSSIVYVPRMIRMRMFGVASFFKHHSSSSNTDVEDDSFISIKFGDNGVASWDKGGSQVSIKSMKSVVEHGKGSCSGGMRWRKRIAQLLHLVRWKRGSTTYQHY